MAAGSAQPLGVTAATAAFGQESSASHGEPWSRLCGGRPSRMGFDDWGQLISSQLPGGKKIQNTTWEESFCPKVLNRWKSHQKYLCLQLLSESNFLRASSDVGKHKVMLKSKTECACPDFKETSDAFPLFWPLNTVLKLNTSVKRWFWKFGCEVYKLLGKVLKALSYLVFVRVHWCQWMPDFPTRPCTEMLSACLPPPRLCLGSYITVRCSYKKSFIGHEGNFKKKKCRATTERQPKRQGPEPSKWSGRRKCWMFVQPNVDAMYHRPGGQQEESGFKSAGAAPITCSSFTK